MPTPRSTKERNQRLTEFREREAEFRETRGAGDSGVRMHEALRRGTTTEDFKRGLEELAGKRTDKNRERDARLKKYGAQWTRED